MMNPHLTTQRQSSVALFLVFTISLALCVAGAVPAAAQSPEKEEREVEDKIPSHLPIKIKIKNPEKSKDLANDRWLADLEFEVKNTGAKPIYFLDFFIDFVDVKRDSGDNIGYSFQYGRSKLVDLGESPTAEDVPLEPGATHVFKLHEDYVKGWNWYRTRVEPKPHPKKIRLFFGTLSHGDGTGYVTTGGIYKSGKRASLERRPEGGPAAAAGCRPARPPDAVSQFFSSFLPVGFLPVNFYPAKTDSSPAAVSVPQTCCPGTPCQSLRRSPGGNCFCPVENPEEGFRIESGPFGCDDPGFRCATSSVQFSECGEGETYRQCVKVFLDHTCAVSTPEPCAGSPRPETCCICSEFVRPPFPGDPGGTFWSWYCAPPNCPLNLPLGNGCVSPSAVVLGIALCPKDYSETVWGSGVCCPNPPPPPNDECPPASPIPCPTDEPAPDPDGGLTDPDQRCCDYSPVLVDVRGDGFALTGPAAGVLFDFNGDGVPSRFSWTAAGSDDAWLALDRDGDGRVGDASELFGNATAQPAPPPGERRNGFLALAVFDRREGGGNGDGLIDHRDTVFTSLRLWRDANHDGLSQPAELFTLPALDVARLHLDYKESKRVDEYGNRFRYRAKIDDARGAKAGRWAWDVFLTKAP